MLSTEGFNNSNEEVRVLQLHLDNLDYKERVYQESRQGRTSRDLAVRFYYLTAVLSDFSVRQIILYDFPKSRNRSVSLVDPTSWIRTIKRSQCQWKGLVDDSEANVDFVRPDGMVNATEPHLKRPYQPPKPIKRQVLGSYRHLFDFSSLYEALHETGVLSTGGEVMKTETVDVDVVVQEAERLLLGDITLAEPLLGTL
jgi:RNA polymerase I-specific transcription initiation factor RRN6